MALTKIKTQSINDNAITNAKMADDAIDSADLADGSIDNVHLAGSIAVSKTLLSAGTGLTLSTNTLNVDAAQTQITSVGTLSSLTLGGDLLVPEYIKHVGDTDTHLRFSADDAIEITAGNVKFMRFLEDDTQDMLVINEDSADIDFRIESNDDANMFFVDGGTNQVGIGTNDPNTKIVRNFSANHGLVISHADQACLQLDETGETNSYTSLVQADTHLYCYNNGAGNLKFYTNGNLELEVTDSASVFSGDIKNSSDSKALYVGASDDLKIHHNGTDSYIQGTEGHLFIHNNKASKDLILLQEGASGGIEFRTNNSVVGRWNHNGNLRLGASESDAKLRIRQDSSQTAAGTNDGTCLYLTGYNANNKYGGGIGWNWNDCGTGVHPAAWIGTYSQSFSSYTKADLVFATRDVVTNSATTERMRIGADGHVTTSKGSGISYEKGSDDDDMMISKDVIEYTTNGNSGNANYKRMKKFIASKSGTIRVTWWSKNTSGSHWWAYRFAKNNGSTTDAATPSNTMSLVDGSTAATSYSYNLHSSNTNSVHNYRRFDLSLKDVKAGDQIEYWMVNSDGGGTPAASSQTLWVKDFRVYTTTQEVSSNPVIEGNITVEDSHNNAGIYIAKDDGGYHFVGNNTHTHDLMIESGGDDLDIVGSWLRIRQSASGGVNAAFHTTGHLNVGGDAQSTFAAKFDGIGGSDIFVGDNASVNSLTERSDERLKKYIKDIPYGESFINKLRPVEFQWKAEATKDGKRAINTDAKQFGLIAQEVKTVIDGESLDWGAYRDRKSDDDEEIVELQYTQFIAPLIKAVQELSAKVKALESA